jgi:hypothetical protein
MGNTWRNRTNTERWERGFAALSKFRAREGHCCPSRHHVEGNFKLGDWVSVQRYRKDFLPVERKRRLDRSGFVWDWRDHLWEQKFAALLKFKRREGHCCVRSFHNEGNVRLGYWVSTQRRNKNENVGGAAGAIKQGRLCVECTVHGSDCLSTKSAAISGAERN